MEIKLEYFYELTEDMQNPSYKDTFNELCNCIKNIDDQEIRLEFDGYCNATYKNYSITDTLLELTIPCSIFIS